MNTKTYSVRNLDMLDQHHHFLARNETLEVAPRLTRARRQDVGSGTIPENATSKRVQLSHESGLAGQLNLDGTITKTADTPGLRKLVVTLSTADRVLHGLELNKCVHGLGRGAVHDDVHRLVGIIEHLAIAADESHDLCTLGRERNLQRLALLRISKEKIILRSSDE